MDSTRNRREPWFENIMNYHDFKLEAARENEDKTGLCKVIKCGLEAKRNKETIPSDVLSLYSSTERRAIQELAIIFVLRLPVYTNKSLQIVKEYMTYNGLFMAKRNSNQ